MDYGLRRQSETVVLISDTDKRIEGRRTDNDEELDDERAGEPAAEHVEEERGAAERVVRQRDRRIPVKRRGTVLYPEHNPRPK